MSIGFSALDASSKFAGARKPDPSGEGQGDVQGGLRVLHPSIYIGISTILLLPSHLAPPNLAPPRTPIGSHGLATTAVP